MESIITARGQWQSVNQTANSPDTWYQRGVQGETSFIVSEVMDGLYNTKNRMCSRLTFWT